MEHLQIRCIGRAGRLVDQDAQSNARLSANLPYLFPVSRFPHYLKGTVPQDGLRC